MASLSTVIKKLFDDSDSYSMIARMYSRQEDPPVLPKRYMEIPVGTDTFELPLLAFTAFRQMLQRGYDGKALVAQLYSSGRMSHYKSLDAVMKDVLSTYLRLSLSKVKLTGVPDPYYATYGAVFDKDLMPLMMLSWVMERRTDGEGVTKYHYKRPLLRVSPRPCLEKADPLQRFIASKMVTTALGTPITVPYFYGCSFIEQSDAWYSRSRFNIKVEIDDCPFIIRSSDTPSISVTNKSLLQLVANHVNEIPL